MRLPMIFVNYYICVARLLGPPAQAQEARGVGGPKLFSYTFSAFAPCPVRCCSAAIPPASDQSHTHNHPTRAAVRAIITTRAIIRHPFDEGLPSPLHAQCLHKRPSAPSRLIRTHSSL